MIPIIKALTDPDWLPENWEARSRVHEAGHALCVLLHGGTVNYVAVEKHDATDSFGRVSYESCDMTDTEVAMMSLAGFAAEAHVFYSDLGYATVEDAYRDLHRRGGDDRMNAIARTDIKWRKKGVDRLGLFAELEAESRAWVAEHIDAIKRVARALEQTPRLSGDDLRTLLSESSA